MTVYIYLRVDITVIIVGIRQSPAPLIRVLLSKTILATVAEQRGVVKDIGQVDTRLSSHDSRRDEFHQLCKPDPYAEPTTPPDSTDRMYYGSRGARFFTIKRYVSS